MSPRNPRLYPRKAAALPLSKPCDWPGDMPLLTEACRELATHVDILEGQHQIRQWEYAMALTALTTWGRGVPTPLRIADIGGAGSKFWKALADQTTAPIVLIDPSLPDQAFTGGPVLIYRESLESYVEQAAPEAFDILTCISVIEHIPDLKPFLKAAHRLLRPGGLLFITTDYWDAEGPDTAHFHWMRQRIYNAELVRRLMQDLRAIGFRSFGEADWRYAGPQVYDYSVASLAMMKTVKR